MYFDLIIFNILRSFFKKFIKYCIMFKLLQNNITIRECGLLSDIDILIKYL